MANNREIVLSVKDLKVYFYNGRGKYKMVVKAIDGINFDIYKGEVFGLVGESGCGKTTTGRTAIQLHNPTDGEIFFLGKRVATGIDGLKASIKESKKTTSRAIAKLKKELKVKIKHLHVSDNNRKKLEGACQLEIEELRNNRDKVIGTHSKEMKTRVRDNKENNYELFKNMQMVFQDPIESLNPRMTVGEIIAEGLVISGLKNKEQNLKQVYKVLKTVGLLPEHASRYPHEFSGGQRQRIGIARAIIVSPSFIIADEPVSALDVSIQAQVINLMNDLRKELGLTLLFIAHDLSVIKYLSDRVGVMYYGKIVELADSKEIFANPLHPYTKSLLSAVPLPDPRYEKNRKRVSYDPRVHDYENHPPKMHEITEGHFIYANEKELEEYRKELNKS